MSQNSKIEWTETTWNPLRGCSRVSEGCKNCYAEQVAMRFRGAGQPYEGLVRMTSQGPKWTGDIKLIPEVLGAPLGWAKPRRVFVNSMSDLFHENVPFEFIDQVFAVMALSWQHTFQILTKRAQRMHEYMTRIAGGRHIWAAAQRIEMPRGKNKPEPPWPLPNVWLGVSVENQDAADERIPLLLQVPAAVRWVSAEPLLGPIDLERVKWPDLDEHRVDVLRGGYWNQAPYVIGAPSAKLGDPKGGFTNHSDMPATIDWVVVGGESGRGARPMHPNWARSLRDQCTDSGVPFFFKQNGEWVSVSEVAGPGPHHQFDDGATVRRTGKKLAGRTLDGNTHDEYPEVA